MQLASNTKANHALSLQFVCNQGNNQLVFLQCADVAPAQACPRWIHFWVSAITGAYPCIPAIDTAVVYTMEPSLMDTSLLHKADRYLGPTVQNLMIMQTLISSKIVCNCWLSQNVCNLPWGWLFYT